MNEKNWFWIGVGATTLGAACAILGAVSEIKCERYKTARQYEEFKELYEKEQEEESE